ncbi:integral membrane protein [Mycobacterium haemophilum DSM 44634]|uniref:hypothetical protein n=1 Tax=Mycobacterium haemophilum TaxID=29311 RepID=UPI0006561B6C|nr:hypothetical protein [Mycobacterium haemophilum]AKN17807.1 hypothetical protein B586_16430 [Mycobacterium haemophilum DSM 44634]MCV7340774.1 hypothetical protein [Mycobacterium haemophilum DSM 44634]
MTSIPRPATRILSAVFGLLMVGSAVVGSDGLAAVAAAVAMLGVGVATVYRPAATLAVLLSVCTIVISNPSQALAALSGLCAAAYLVFRYAAGTPVAGVMASWPTIIAAVGFTFVGLVATSFPLQLPWLPLAAPLAVLAIYVLATRPFMG